MRARPEPVLELRDLTTVFPTRRGEVRAVDGLNLTLLPGQILGLVGESGCGKSTVLLSILRLIASPGRIEKGQILLNGHDLRAQPRHTMRSIRGKEMAMRARCCMPPLNSWG